MVDHAADSAAASASRQFDGTAHARGSGAQSGPARRQSQLLLDGAASSREPACARFRQSRRPRLADLGMRSPAHGRRSGPASRARRAAEHNRTTGGPERTSSRLTAMSGAVTMTRTWICREPGMPCDGDAVRLLVRLAQYQSRSMFTPRPTREGREMTRVTRRSASGWAERL